MEPLVLSPADTTRGLLVLINGEHSLRQPEEEIRMELAEDTDLRLRRECARQLLLLLAACRGKRYLLPTDGYRSGERQQELYLDSLRDNGASYTERFVALPGVSEHQTGLAVDMAKKEPRIDPICPFFPDSGRCGVFRRMAPDFGFIERYPEGKEALTGRPHQPWHFRYVGAPHARLIADSGLTLEEYLRFLTGFGEGRPLLTPDGSDRIYHVPSQGEQTLIFPPEQGAFQVSGDNCGGFIVTVMERSFEHRSIS